MGMGESNSGTDRVQISGTAPVADAANAAREFAIENDIRGNDLSRLCVIVEELIANIYEHGGVGPDDCVEMSLSTGPDEVRLKVIDPGRPFDPRRAKSSERRPARGGGAGIDIVRNWASHIDYRVSNGRNYLELRIPLGSDGAESQS